MRILCIDDEPDILQLMADFLELMEIDVMTADSGKQGLEILLAENGNFDAVVTDMKMPHMSGLELLKEMRAIGLSTPVIMASGQYDEDPDQLSRQHNIAAIITKPFTLANFKEVLDVVVGK